MLQKQSQKSVSVLIPVGKSFLHLKEMYMQKCYRHFKNSSSFFCLYLRNDALYVVCNTEVGLFLVVPR